VAGELKEGAVLVQKQCTGEPNQTFHRAGKAIAISSSSAEYSLSVGFLQPNKQIFISTKQRPLRLDQIKIISNFDQTWVELMDFSHGSYPFPCVEVKSGLFDDDTPVLLQNCPGAPNNYQQFALTRIDLNSLPQGEAVTCSVFYDGGSPEPPHGPHDSFFISGPVAPRQPQYSCIPGDTFRGICAKWLGYCHTTKTFQPVAFRVFNDGDSEQSDSSDAIFVADRAGNPSCIPGASDPICRKWFGLGRVSDGRNVRCKVFNDGYSNASELSNAIHFQGPIPADGVGTACIPDGSSKGLCRRWFGQCLTD
jgi:hypothetical protein